MEKRQDPYVYGSAAPKIEYSLYENNKVLKYKKKLRSVKKQKSKLVYIILMLFILGVTVIFRYSQITELNFKIDASRMEYVKLLNENDILEAEIEKNINLEEIKFVAINKLNMRKPYKHQIEYIRIEKKDYSVTVNKYKKPELPDANIITLLIRNIGKAVNIIN